MYFLNVKIIISLQLNYIRLKKKICLINFFYIYVFFLYKYNGLMSLRLQLDFLEVINTVNITKKKINLKVK